MHSFTSHLRPGDRMPAFFVGHGNPMNAILDTDFSRRGMARYRAVARTGGLSRNHRIRPIETQPGRIEPRSTIACPECGHAETETMPTDAWQWFYDCKGCAAVLRPLPGDCCVYCSYGTVPCPPIQAGDGHC